MNKCWLLLCSSIVFTVFLSSCSYTYQARKYSDPAAPVSEDKGRIVVIRKGTRPFTSDNLSVFEDTNNFIGKFGSYQKHFSWEVSPGIHLLRFKNISRNTYYEVNVKPNKTYYLTISHYLRLIGYEMRIKSIDEDSALQRIKKQKRPHIHYLE